VGLAVIVVVFAVVLPRIADYGHVWSVVTGLSYWAIAALVAIALVNVATFAPPWMAALPGLSYVSALRLTMTSTALSNTTPGGDAAGAAIAYAMLRSWGFGRSSVALGAIVTAVWNQFVNVGVPLVALVLLAVLGESNTLLSSVVPIGLVALVVLVVGVGGVFRSIAAARRIGELGAALAGAIRGLFGRGRPEGWGEAVVRFRSETLVLLRRRWHYLTVATLVGHLTVWLVLLVALRAVGVTDHQVGVVESLAAWSLIRLLTAVPITPAGVGIVELGLSTALIGFGGSHDRIVAAVLLYRLLTLLPPILFGGVLILTWRHSHPMPETDAAGDGSPA